MEFFDDLQPAAATAVARCGPALGGNVFLEVVGVPSLSLLGINKAW